MLCSIVYLHQNQQLKDTH